MGGPHTCLATRGRPAQPAQRADRNAVYQFVRERGAGTPLVAVQAAFPQLRRRDMQEVLRRYRRVAQKKRLRQQSRLRWLRVGAVWAADFKERREPLEGRYPWILAVKDPVKSNKVIGVSSAITVVTITSRRATQPDILASVIWFSSDDFTEATSR